MTPQERELITGLFDRLSRLEGQARDPEAEREITQGLSRAPHAPYALVQTVLIQDEALKAANARIEQMQAALGQGADPEPHPTGFLDSMRDALFGEGRHGSVPSVGRASRTDQAPRPPQPSPFGSQAEYSRPALYGQGGYSPPASPPGHSFLGTAAAAAAGMVGGSLLLGGIRSMLGGSGQGPFAGTFDHPGGGSQAGFVDEYAPVRDSSLGGGPDSLAAQAGLDDVGRDDRGAGFIDTDDTAADDFGDSFDGGSDDA